jgi:hypothetical protein
MRRCVNVLILVLVLVVAGSLVVAGASRMRDAAARTQCVNNLRQIALGLHNYHDTHNRFPRAALGNGSLPPERRLSWLVDTITYFDQLYLVINRQAAWDAEENLVPKARDEESEWPLGEVNLLRCPSHPASATAASPGLTYYVGITGLGPDAAARGVAYPGTGVFGYDRQTRLQDITDGLGTTLLLVETMRKNGPWTAGGFATARGVDPAGGPYLGIGGQLGSKHRGTNVAFADSSVRTLPEDISPQVFEGMATIAGGEE